jgi:hypothetical protein
LTPDRKAGKRRGKEMDKLPMEYIINELRAFRKALKTSDLDLAADCYSHLENTIIPELRAELDNAFEKGGN